MFEKRRILIAVVALMICVGSTPGAIALRTAAGPVPGRVSDQEFWRMSQDFSEPNGYFRSDNLLSNEMWMQYVIPDLVRRTRPGGVYLGVGPEQNFTYIAAVKPRLVFITDIRRGNLHTQLMYKAIFELSADRADFVARLFTKKRPGGLNARSTAQQIFAAFASVPAGDEAAYRKNLDAIRGQLLQKHGLPLSKEDQDGIAYVYHSFYTFGPEISYNSTGRGFGWRGGQFLTYADLMTETDENGVNHGFLANDENYKVVRELEVKNLIIPVVGDFAGPKALRAIGKYLKEHQATVVAFYLSNVEQYLGDGWTTFCANVANLPLDDSSTFIRTVHGNYSSPGYGRGGRLTTTLGGMHAETKGCAGTSSPFPSVIRRIPAP